MQRFQLQEYSKYNAKFEIWEFLKHLIIWNNSDGNAENDFHSIAEASSNSK